MRGTGFFDEAGEWGGTTDSGETRRTGPKRTTASISMTHTICPSYNFLFQAVERIDEISLRLDLAYGKWHDVGTKR